MAARDGMANLILQVRRLVNDTGTADWTDDEVQDALDRYRLDVVGECLTPAPTEVDGEVVYTVYMLRHKDVEGTASGTEAWRLYDSNGSAATGYTLDEARGLVRFTADQGGTAYYADYRSYDPYRSAADLWEERAAEQANRYEFQAGGGRFRRDQYFEHCLTMATILRKRAKLRAVQVRRRDTE